MDARKSDNLSLSVPALGISSPKDKCIHRVLLNCILLLEITWSKTTWGQKKKKKEDTIGYSINIPVYF